MTSQRNGCGCKVGRVSRVYELPKEDTQLVEKWQSGTSVRQLTEEINKDIVRSKLETANVGQIKLSQSPVYKALHTNELSKAEEIKIRRELDHAGIDVEKLSSDLVSHQTVYRHLKQCLDVSKGEDQTPNERREKAKDTVYALQQRTEIVTESTIHMLQTADITNLGNIEVVVDLQIVCDDCGRSMDFESAISQGCKCDSI